MSIDGAALMAGDDAPSIPQPDGFRVRQDWKHRGGRPAEEKEGGGEEGGGLAGPALGVTRMSGKR